MAKIDIINIRGNKEQCVNLSDSVGVGGKNLKSDIMLIQALFLYLYFDKDTKITGLPIRLPQFALIEKLSVTGFYDLLTLQTVAIFQLMHRRHLLNADGIIHPAKYEGRVIKDTAKPLMTITYLHLLAKRRELRSGDGDYIRSVNKTILLYHSFEFVAGRVSKH